MSEYSFKEEDASQVKTNPNVNNIVKTNNNVEFNQNIMISNPDLFRPWNNSNDYIECEYTTDHIGNRYVFAEFDQG